jgi:hypothetical protein
MPKKDRYAAIADLQNDKHRKIEDMFLPDSKYQLFFAVVHSVKGLKTKSIVSIVKCQALY